MWQLLDVVVMAVLVACSAGYAVYALSPVRFKRTILSRLVKMFGVRVFSVFSPRLGGCGQCAGESHPAAQLRKSARLK